jgi:hypothetical protein
MTEESALPGSEHAIPLEVAVVTAKARISTAQVASTAKETRVEAEEQGLKRAG